MSVEYDQKLKELIDSDPQLKQRLTNYESFSSHVERIKQQYSFSQSPKDLVDGISLLSENPDYHPFAHFLIFLGDSYMESGDFEAGATCMKSVVAHFPEINHYAIIYLRMAQYHIEKGETEIGIGFLIQLCTEVRDYKSQIVLNDLTVVWEKYKHLLAGKIPELDVTDKLEPINFVQAPRPLPPEKCSQTISLILSLSKSNLLSALSTHLGEMTANGTSLNSLNKWERIFYYADEICMEVNSGGFEGYLYYHGTHFAKAYKAFEQIGTEQMLRLMDRIQSKFPRSRIPKSEEAIQNAMDRMEEAGMDFDDEDEIYHSSAEKELLDRLTTYVLENQNHFR